VILGVSLRRITPTAPYWSGESNEDQLMLRGGIGAVLHHATPAAADLPSPYLHLVLTFISPGGSGREIAWSRLTTTGSWRSPSTVADAIFETRAESLAVW